MIIPITSEYDRSVFYILAALIGLCVGSFLNVVIYRLPLHMSLAYPPSHCPKCGYVLKPYDNIPIVSYLMLGGKCRKCRTHISFRYTLVEGANMILWLLCALLYADNFLYACIAALVCSVCICVCFIDLEHMYIPDRFQLILAGLAIPAILCDRQWTWQSHIIGLAVAALFFIGIGWLMGALLHREALGGGDVKFAMAAGLFLGWQKLLLMVLLASVSASIVMVRQKHRSGVSREQPFGPFLSAGMVIAMLFGDSIIRWYLSLLLF